MRRAVEKDDVLIKQVTLSAYCCLSKSSDEHAALLWCIKACILQLCTSVFACSSWSCRAFSVAAAVEASSFAWYCASASSSLVALICFSSSSISGSRAYKHHPYVLVKSEVCAHIDRNSYHSLSIAVATVSILCSWARTSSVYLHDRCFGFAGADHSSAHT